MTTTTVSTTSGLLAALATASAGDTVLLASGTYANVNISNLNFSGQVNIQSADTSNPATITGLNVENSSGLAFQNLTLSAASATPGSSGSSNTYSFNFNGVSNIELNGLNVEGNPAWSYANAISGLSLESYSNVSITNSTFSNFHYGIQQLKGAGLNISNNVFNYIWDDSIRGGGTSDVLIANNTFSDDHGDVNDVDHPDDIQFWSTDFTTGASNITITGNEQSRGTGQPGARRIHSRYCRQLAVHECERR